MTVAELWGGVAWLWERIRDWILVFVAGGFLAPRLHELATTARLVVQEDPNDPMIGRRSEGAWAFFHVQVMAVSRWRFLPSRPPRAVRAFVSITDVVTGQRINAPARWVDWPEPLIDIPVPRPDGTIQLVPFPDRGELARQRTMDFIALDLPHRVDVAVKVEDDSAVYFWNNDNYKEGRRVDAHPPFGQGNHSVEVRLEYEGRTVHRNFELSNGGTSWKNVRLRQV